MYFDGVDMIGRRVLLPAVPKRIVSLVPSQTELLYDLGLRDEVVGITKFCVHPNEWFRNKTRIGGTKSVHIDKVLSLNPDLVIANKEENVREQVEAISATVPVWTSDINDLSSARKMIESISLIVNRIEGGKLIVDAINSGLKSLTTTTNFPLKVAYFIWRNPWMCAGADTFISSLISEMGWENAVSEMRYPEISLETLRERKPDVVLLSSEPYPFKEKHVEELRTFVPDAKIVMVDGEMFSWYGSRLVESMPYLQNLRKVIRGT